MLAKDKFLEKINLLFLIFFLCFCHNLYAQNIYKKILNYNDSLKNSSANFIQTNNNQLQEGRIFFGDKRIKITYDKPEKITIILSEKKGMYINHGLKESEFFVTKKSYIKNFFDIFHKKNHLENMIVEGSDDHIKITQETKLDNDFFYIRLIYENDPIKLRRLEIKINDDEINMGFFDHIKETVFDKSFFSMIDPYLN